MSAVRLLGVLCCCGVVVCCLVLTPVDCVFFVCVDVLLACMCLLLSGSLSILLCVACLYDFGCVRFVFCLVDVFNMLCFVAVFYLCCVILRKGFLTCVLVLCLLWFVTLRLPLLLFSRVLGVRVADGVCYYCYVTNMLLLVRLFWGCFVLFVFVCVCLCLPYCLRFCVFVMVSCVVLLFIYGARFLSLLYDVFVFVLCVVSLCSVFVCLLLVYVCCVASSG